ncbi:MAG: metalloregulator ArsR/SmtB family transcription factor [Patescibacteria group bacterium]|nr:metalloregulator ArsR/SmtB family transcription factor [Patescibacteria group bacterium]
MKFKEDCSTCFAGLACFTRAEIINLLQEKERMSVLEIARHFSVTQSTITHHLKYLEEAGVLKSEREGRKIFYSIHQKCSKKDCNIFV